MDRATGWVEAVPLTDISARTVAEEIYKAWITRYGVPLYLLTDRGSQFQSEIMIELSKLLGICRLRTTSYHPQTNGKLERFHKELKIKLRCLRSQNPSCWLDRLPSVLWYCRTKTNQYGLSPFFLLMTRQTYWPRFLVSDRNADQNLFELDEEIRKLLRQTRTLQGEKKIIHNEGLIPTLREGEKVL